MKFKIGDMVEYTGEKNHWSMPDTGTVGTVITGGDCICYNSELTVEDLEGMDGERVWCEVVSELCDFESDWHTVNVSKKLLVDDEGRSFGFNSEFIKAYRYKPENTPKEPKPEKSIGSNDIPVLSQLCAEMYKYIVGKSDNVENNKPMPELKTGMVVELKNGNIMHVAMGTEFGDILKIIPDAWMPLDKCLQRNYCNSNWLIEKIFTHKCEQNLFTDKDLTLIWQRTPKQITIDEAQSKLSEAYGCQVEIVDKK